MSSRLRSIRKVLYACILFFAFSTQTNAIAIKININTADVKQLTQLKHVGAAYADRIIAYREANGDFASPEGIMKVKGIGKRIYEANKEIIIVSEETLEKQ